MPNEYQQELEKFQLSVEIARDDLELLGEPSKQNCVDHVTQLGRLCNRLLPMLLVSCRFRLSDAKQHASEIVRLARFASELLNESPVRLSGPVAWLNFETATLVAYMSTRGLDADLYSKCRKRKNALHGEFADLDRLLLKAFSERKSVTRSVTNRLRRDFGLKTPVSNSFLDYCAAVDAALAQDEKGFRDAISECERRYSERSKDVSVTHFGVNDGAERFCEMMIDLRIACLLVFAKEVGGFKVPRSIHRI